MFVTLVVAATLVAILTVTVALALTSRKTQRLREAGVVPQEGQETAGDVDRLLQLGHKIEAVKVYRALHHVGLKEAKDAVEERQRQIGLR